jgi:hypothetical protein
MHTHYANIIYKFLPTATGNQTASDQTLITVRRYASNKANGVMDLPKANYVHRSYSRLLILLTCVFICCGSTREGFGTFERSNLTEGWLLGLL